MTLKLRHLLLLVLFLASSHSVFSQKLSPKQMKEDLFKAKELLERYHPNPYAYTTKNTLNQKWEEAEKQIATDSLDMHAFFRVLAPVIAAVQDGHTSTLISPKIYGKNARQLPFFIRKFNGKYYVNYAAAADTTFQRGMELHAIEGIPMDSLVRLNERVFGNDNGNPVSNSYYAIGAFPSFYARNFGQKDSLLVTFKHADSLDFTSKKLEMMSSSAIIKRISFRYKDALKKNFKYVIEDSTAKIARLEISSFSLSGKFLDVSQRKFKRLLKQRFTQIEKDSIQHLLIDFRGNGGGYIPNVRRFVSYLAKEPFQLVDSLTFKKTALSAIAPWFTVFPPLITRLVFKKSPMDGYFGRKNPSKLFDNFPKKAFSGKTYFLMDGGSYSATTFTLGLLYDQGVGTYIGTQPGGANWGSFAGNWKNAKLPHSKLILHIPLFKIDHRLPNQRAKSFFIQPDLWVEPSWADFLNRKDTVVEFTKQMIRSSVNSK